jgi:prepilin-type N-terminal cleavage/methylation domain-containing protein
MRKTEQAGFTLIEMAVVVAVIAVLASVAIQQFMSDEREATADSEVNAMFTELGLKEQEYKLENGVYFSTGATEAATFPTVPGKAPQSLAAAPATWTTLKVLAPPTARCGYVVIAGLASAAPGALASGTFGFVAPKQPYYYVLAHCNLDGDATKDGYYFQSSVDSTIKNINAGF